MPDSISASAPTIAIPITGRSSVGAPRKSNRSSVKKRVRTNSSPTPAAATPTTTASTTSSAFSTE